MAGCRPAREAHARSPSSTRRRRGRCASGRQPEPTTGPYDVRDRPDDDIARVDLGGLLVPAGRGFELRLDVAENQQVHVGDAGELVRPHAARRVRRPAQPGHLGRGPRRDHRSVRAQGGTVKEREDGPFGTELVGTLQGGRALDARCGSSGSTGRAGSCGRCWSAPWPTTRPRPARSRTALRNVVVVRGSEPLPVREQVPLQLAGRSAHPGGATTMPTRSTRRRVDARGQERA